ncbi:hypothetical protein ANN_07357 [Periplaneta americana]|uniref:Uncharacterized protein n=1 Tax=Periplaneta americana TaxID=6978 RepID=A0ABQ8SZZ8_PERAM|nr:hypothetical protein ANN_07357 [Periplaneta americana]
MTFSRREQNPELEVACYPGIRVDKMKDELEQHKRDLKKIILHVGTNDWDRDVNWRKVGHANKAEQMGTWFVDPNSWLDDRYLGALSTRWWRRQGRTGVSHEDGSTWSGTASRFSGRWIGRGEPTSWPPRSPDLTPLDFFLWGFLKDQVYLPPLPANLSELRNRITAAI